MESWWPQVDGFLKLFDGEFDDFVIYDEDLADELADWNRDRFVYRGKTLRLASGDFLTPRRQSRLSHLLSDCR